ncbi:MAG: iron ABC transporter permease [Sneathiella sp.]|nr:iron ABC transporter permease [Sneathiella sp.]
MSELSSRSLADQYRRFSYRRYLWICLFAATIIGITLFNIMSGPAGLGIWDVLKGIWSPDSLSPTDRTIIWDFRLPYSVMAICVGACLGLAGAEMQTVLNNPLASPSTLGVLYAATLGASIAILIQAAPFGISQNYIIPVFAFLGAITSILMLLGVSRLFGATADTVILFGIAMVFALQALISLIQFVADSDSLQQIVFWTMGSLARASWEKVFIIAAALAVCVPFSVRHMWKMTALRGGEEYAKSYGVSVDRLRLIVLLRVSVLTAVAVSFTGVIGFVGLVGPHISRLVFGEDHRFYLPGAALASAVILSGASVLSKSIIPGILIPDGIVTALIGIPLFLALLINQKRKGLV